MMVAIPSTAHNFHRARIFDTGLVIIKSPWSIVSCMLGSEAAETATESRVYRFRVGHVYRRCPVDPMTKAHVEARQLVVPEPAAQSRNRPCPHESPPGARRNIRADDTARQRARKRDGLPLPVICTQR